MKTNIFEVIKKAIPNQTYASAVQTSSQSSGRKSTTQRDSLHTDAYTGVKRGDAATVQHNQSNKYSTTDEGICDGSKSVLGSSQTFVKTVNSPVAISITWKMVPHELLLWFPFHWAMLVQKLHDATLASLSVLEKSRWRPKWSS